MNFHKCFKVIEGSGFTKIKEEEIIVQIRLAACFLM